GRVARAAHQRRAQAQRRVPARHRRAHRRLPRLRARHRRSQAARRRGAGASARALCRRAPRAPGVGRTRARDVRPPPPGQAASAAARMMRARAAVARGWRELVRAPVPTLAAVLGTIAGALAARAALLRAGQAMAAERPGRAVLTWLVGMSVAALLVDVT